MGAISQFASVENVLKYGIPIGFTVMDYNRNREEGNSVVGSALSAVGTNVYYSAIGLKGAIALEAVSAVPKAAIKGLESLEATSRSMNRNSVNTPFKNATFVDSQQAYTMRQAGMQLAQASKYNLQQTLMGNEAQYMRF